MTDCNIVTSMAGGGGHRAARCFFANKSTDVKGLKSVADPGLSVGGWGFNYSNISEWLLSRDEDERHGV